MVEINPSTMQEDVSKRLEMIEEILSNLVDTIANLQKNQDDGAKGKKNMIGESSQIEKRLP